jgi:3-deoxy-D-manno-octulosonate 8-phosphate phosphatase KdsC-like HAD superfamily phosphatase
MIDIAESLPIMDGAERALRMLKKFGFKIAILSGGFTYFGNYLKKQFDLDYVYANELEIVDGKLTGRHLGDIVDGKRKADLLRLIAQVEGLDLQQVIAVGDGANDLPMISLAGLGVAFHAKPKVKENAKQSLSNFGLDGLLYLLVNQLLDTVCSRTSILFKLILACNNSEICNTGIGRLEGNACTTRSQIAICDLKSNISRIVRLKCTELLREQRGCKTAVIAEYDDHILGVRIKLVIERMHHLTGICMQWEKRLVVLQKELLKFIHSHILIHILKELQPHILIVSGRGDEEHR